jgi:hypothetical protein
MCCGSVTCAAELNARGSQLGAFWCVSAGNAVGAQRLAEASFEMRFNKLGKMTPLTPLKQWGVSIADFFALAIRCDRMPQVRSGGRSQI